jgi:dephospho-CoA kinase
MIKVGVTGGIGSGKSLVCEIFSHLGVPVYNADNEARNLTMQDPEIRKELVALLGEQVFEGNKLNRIVMADRIFHDKSLLEQVNQMIHPRVALHFKNWCTQYEELAYVVHESAILFESNTYLGFDRIITVYAPEDIRTGRVMARAGMNKEKIRAIINNQLPEHEKMRRSDYVIFNDEIKLVIPQVLNIHHKLNSLTQ